MASPGSPSRRAKNLRGTCSLEDAKAAAQLNATHWNVTEGLCSFRSKPPGSYP